jgi:hypothetical protein
LAGQMDSGEKIAAWHAGTIDNQLPGGLDGVAVSFSEEHSELRSEASYFNTQ